MEGLKKEDLIRFDDLNVAAAHARMLSKKFKWIAVDFDKTIFGYNVKPILDPDFAVSVWSYNVGDYKSTNIPHCEPIGIYTGDTPWNRTLQRTIKK